MSNGSVNQAAQARQAAPARSIENYLREFETAEGKVAESKDQQVTDLLQRLRARRPSVLALMASDSM
jgi:hypothetical protein